MYSFVLLVALAAGPDTSPPATFYVRDDGGSAEQCDGRRDAAYPGKGTHQACAWWHPF